LSALHELAPLVVGERGLSEERNRSLRINGFSSLVDVLLGLHKVNDLGCNCHRAHSLFMTSMPDVEHLETLSCPNFELMVHLGNQRAHRIDNDARMFSSLDDYFGCRTMRTQHEWRSSGNL
jgi:hypothetical protein